MGCCERWDAQGSGIRTVVCRAVFGELENQRGGQRRDQGCVTDRSCTVYYYESVVVPFFYYIFWRPIGVG